MTAHPDASDDLLARRSGGGALMLFGLPFLAAGVFVMGASIGLWAQEGKPPEWYVGLPFGGLFAVVGAGIMFGRGGVMLDRRNNLVTKWWGLLVPFSRKTFPLSAYHLVTLTREIRRTKNSTCTVFPVRLTGDAQPITWKESRDYLDARREAEAVARFLRHDLLDATSGNAVRRKPNVLDESLREQVRRTGLVLNVPPLPAGSRIAVQIEGRSMIVTLPTDPAPGRLIGALVTSVVPVAILLLLFGSVARSWVHTLGHATPLLLAGILLVALIPGTIVFLLVMRAARTRTEIVVSPDALELHEGAGRKQRVTRIPSTELEEVIAPPFGAEAEMEQRIAATQMPKALEALRPWLITAARRRDRATGITARSDTAAIEFGSGLTPDEIRWLHAVIVRVLAA